MGRPILLAAGGTGGHLFPAAALAASLAKRGAEVELATDSRALKYGGDFPARAIHTFPAATTTDAGALAKARAALLLAPGLRRARAAHARHHGRAPWSASAAIRPCRRCSPPRFMRVPSVLHEQNAVWAGPTGS